MVEWMMWFVLAGVLVILEMFTGTFYLLMIGVGMTAGGVSALMGASGEVQLLVAAVVGVIATYGLRRSKLGKVTRRDVARDPNVNLDIGQHVMVEAWSGSEGEARTARVTYRGAQWDVELEHGASARPGSFVIREVRGSRLIVGNSGK
jgi:membrane protein implicated in regulation of membrane protease activity